MENEDEKEVLSKVKQKRTFNVEKWFEELRNCSNVEGPLQQFVISVEKFQQGETDNDVILKFLSLTEKNGGYIDIANLLEGKRKPGEITYIARTLELIMLRLSQDLPQFSNIGLIIVRHVMKTSVNVIYVTLKNKRLGAIRAVLRMLTSFVVLNNQSAQEVLNNFSFERTNYPVLLSRTAPKQEYDVRGSMIHLVLSFFLTEDINIINKLLEKFLLIQCVFANITWDKSSNIRILLSTFLEKVIKNESILKSHKIKIFDTLTLLRIAKLFSWTAKIRGDEQRRKEIRVKTENVEVTVPVNSSEWTEEQIEIFEITQEYLTAIFSKSGIIREDETVGTSGKNLNQAVTNFMKSIPNGYENPFCKELFVNILTNALDQLKFYQNTITVAREPRNSSKWFQYMDFISKVYNKLNPYNYLQTLKTKFEQRALTKIVSCMLFPLGISFSQALNHQDSALREVTLKFLHGLVKGAEKFVKNIHGLSSLGVVDVSNFPHIIKKIEKKLSSILPDESSMERIWFKMILENVSRDISAPITTLKLILEIHSILQESFPSLAKQMFINFSNSDVELQILLSEQTESEIISSQLRIMELLPKSTIGDNLIKHETSCSKIFDFLINFIINPVISMQEKAEIALKELMCNRLHMDSTEAEIWIYNFNAVKKSSQLISVFFYAVILDLMKQSKKSNKDNNFICSKMVTIALQQLQKIPAFSSDIWCVNFVSSVIRNLLHVKKNFDIISRCRDKKLKLSSELRDYFKLISSSEVKKRPSSVEVENLDQYLELIMIQRNNESFEISEERLDDLLEFSNLYEKRQAVYQMLFYLQILLQKESDHFENLLQQICDVLQKLGTLSSDLNRLILSDDHIQEYCFKLNCWSRCHPLVTLTVFLIDQCETKTDFTWYFEGKMIILRKLPNFINENDNVVDSKTQKVILALVKKFSTDENMKLLESLSIEVLLSCEWLAKSLCKIIDRSLTTKPVPGLSYKCVEKLLMLTENKYVCKLLRTSFKLCPTNSFVIPSELLERVLEEENSFLFDVITTAMSFNVYIQQKFGFMIRNRDLRKYNADKLIILFKIYLSFHVKILKNLSGESRDYFKNEILELVTKMEELKILNLKSLMNTLDDGKVEILQVLSDLQCLDLKKTKKYLRKVNDDNMRLRILKIIWAENAHQLLVKGIGLLEKQFAEEECDGILCIDIVDEIIKSFQKVDKLELILEEDATIDWELLTKNLLQFCLRNKDQSSILELLRNVITKVNNTPIKISETCEMMFGHSNFFPILFDEKKDFSKHKDLILDLWIDFISLDPSICKVQHIPLLLCSYNATLSYSDQKILHLLSIYDKYGIDFSEYKPFVWSKDAILCYSIYQNMNSTLHKALSVDEVLQRLDKQKLRTTALNFPVDLKLKPDVYFACDNQLYDPRYILPFLNHLLTPSNYVKCNTLVDSGVIALAISSLSSKCDLMRRMGYYTLYLIYEQFEISRFQLKSLWIQFFDVIRNGIKSENTRLPNIITTYLANVSYLILDPENPSYTPVTSFLLSKSELNFDNIPDALLMFNSTDLKHDNHREWILKVATEGIKDKFDFFLFEKRQMLTSALCFANSTLTSQNHTLNTLKVLLSCSKIEESTWKLLNYGILPYLHQLVTDIQENNKVFELIVQLIRNLWFTFYKTKNSHFFLFPTEFFLLIQVCLDIDRNFLTSSLWNILMSVLSSVCNHLENSRKLLPVSSQHSITSLTCNLQILKILKLSKQLADTTEEVSKSSEPSDDVCRVLMHFTNWILSFAQHSKRDRLSSDMETVIMDVIEVVTRSSFVDKSVENQIDFLRFVRNLLSNNSFKCCLSKSTAQRDGIGKWMLELYRKQESFNILIEVNLTMIEWFLDTVDENEKIMSSVKCIKENLRDSKNFVPSHFSVSTYAINFLLKKLSSTKKEKRIKRRHDDNFVSNNKRLKVYEENGIK